MKTKFDWDDLAKKVIDALGGKENIKSFKHCATRLRVELKDESLIDKQSLNNLELAKGYNIEGKQHQLIFGAGTVNKVFDSFQKIINHSLTKETKKSEVKEPWWDRSISIWSNIFMILRRGLRNFADIFIPLIPVLIAGGIGLAMNSLLTQVGANSQAALEFAKIFDLIGGTIYTLLPAFIGYTLMKKLGGNQMIGLAIGLILVGPALLASWTYLSGSYYNSAQDLKDDVEAAIAAGDIDGAISIAQTPVLLTIFYGFAGGFFKIEFASYQSQIVPVMLATILGYWVERGMKKITHESIALIAIPVVTVFVTTYLSLWAIGPLGRILNIWLAEGFNGMYKYTNYTGIGFGGMIIGFLWSPFVITGLHQAPLMLEPGILANFNGELGHSFTWLNPVIFGAQPAMGFAILAALIHIKKEYRKQMSSIVVPSAVTANMGVTEPAIFGVALPLKYPMLGAMIGGGLAGYWAGMTQFQANSIGSASWIGLIQFDFTAKYSYGDVIYNNQEVFNNLKAIAGETRGWIDEAGLFHPSYFASQNIHSAFQSWPPVAHAAITLSLGALGGFVSTFFLGKTKWGKKCLDDFYTKRGLVKDQNINTKKISAPSLRKKSIISSPVNKFSFLRIFKSKMQVVNQFNSKTELLITNHLTTISNFKKAVNN